MPVFPRKLFSLVMRKPRALFPEHLTPQLKSFYLSISIRNFAAAMVAIFEPIYLHSIGFALWQIALYYAAVYALYFFVIPLGGKFVERFGFSHGIMAATFFAVVYFVCLLNIPHSPIFLALAILSLTVEKALYWIGYHSDFAFFGQTGARGREIANMALLDSFVIILGPLLGGTLITYFGYSALYAVAGIVILLSAVPLALARELVTPRILSYRQCLRELSAPHQRRVSMGLFGFGEEMILLIVWPIFIYLSFGSALGVGWAVGASTFVTMIVIMLTGWASDTRDRNAVLRMGAVFTSMAWGARLFAASPVAVFAVDLFSRSARNILMLPMFSGVYEHASHDSIVRTVVFFEMTLCIAKAAAALCVAFLFFFVPAISWHAAFVLAAFFSLFYLLMAKPQEQPLFRRLYSRFASRAARTAS